MNKPKKVKVDPQVAAMGVNQYYYSQPKPTLTDSVRLAHFSGMRVRISLVPNTKQTKTNKGKKHK